MAGLAAYRRVLGDPRARAFSLAGLVARLPLSMTGLGMVLLISITTGSFGQAGLVTGAATLAGAVAAPLWGRTIDRVGQARVLVTAAVINSVSLTMLITSVLLGWTLAVTLLAAVGAGLGFSSAGASVRARWAYRLKGTPMLNTAYAFEAVLDEVVFIVGPVLATFLATAVHPALGLATSVALGLVGALVLAGLRDTQPPPVPRRAVASAAERMPLATLVPIALAFAALGALFGGMEVVIVAFAQESGLLPLAGLMVMAWASGSLVAGVVTGAIAWSSPPTRRFRVGAVALGVSVLPLPFASEAGPPVLVAGLLVLSGVTIAPTLIASTAVTQRAVPASRLTEALSWTSTGLAAGLALGSAALGQVIDTAGAVTGFWGVVVIGGLLILAAIFVRGAPAGSLSQAPPDIEPAAVRRERADTPSP